MLKRRTVIRPSHPEAIFLLFFYICSVSGPIENADFAISWVGFRFRKTPEFISVGRVDEIPLTNDSANSAHPRSLGLHAGSPCFSNPFASSLFPCFSKKSVFAESGMICGLTELFFGRITSGSCRRSQPAALGGVIMVNNQPIHQNLSETVRGRAAIR